MKTGKVITGLAVGAVVALIVIPKTRKMISDAVCSITDSLKGFMDEAKDAAQDTADKGRNEMNRLGDKARDVAGTVKSNAKEAWQA